MNSLKITSLANPTQSSDCINREYGDNSFISSSTTLNAITAPTSSVSLNSNKITNLANATLASDALNR